MTRLSVGLRLSAAALAIPLLTACGGSGKTAAPSAVTSAAPQASAAASSSPAAAGSASVVAVTEKDFQIDVATLSVPSNVTFNVHSDGPTPHSFNIRDGAGTVVVESDDLRQGEDTTVTAQLAPGTYTFFCDFAGHESLGMHGTLTVTP